jgi:hypothetical protein
MAKSSVSTSESLGIRLVSYTNFKDGQKLEATKSQNLRLKLPELLSKIEEIIPFGLRGQVGDKIQALREAYQELLKLKPNYRMYSASILVCYDGDQPCGEIRIALIDFAHGHFDITASGADPNDPEYDDGVLIGIESFALLIQELNRNAE